MITDVRNKMLSIVEEFIKPGTKIDAADGYLSTPVVYQSEATKANAFYFNNVPWAEEYLQYCHRNEFFKSRWEAALGDCEDKIVVDIGCGPGNIFATVSPKPKILLGVDVACNSLKLCRQFGYVPILADAENLPFISGFADLVVLNATLHHCENMEAVLLEAARLVRPGGLMITDHDPQLSAWNYKGLAKLLWQARLIYFRVTRHGFHKSLNQQSAALATEIHHKPGSGVDEGFFKNTLEPLGFQVNIFPHNHQLGSEVLKGNPGVAQLKYRAGNFLSGRNPSSSKSALSLMCVAKKQRQKTLKY